jgi:transposase
MGRGAVLSDEKIWGIVHYMREGHSVTDTARRVGCDRKAVYKWWRRHTAGEAMKPAIRSGRKRALDAAAEEHVLDMLTETDGVSADQASKHLCAEGLTPVPLHKATVINAARRAAVRTGKKLWVRRGKPPKAPTSATMQKRLAFAVEHQNTEWSHTLFTDRKKFHFRYPGSKVKPAKWVLGSAKGSCAAVNQPNHPQCLNIYAGISKHGVTAVHVVAGSSKHTTQHTNKQGKQARNITSSEYKEVLQKTLLPEGKRLFSAQGTSTWTLQQDNDPTHKCAAEQIKQWNHAKGSSVLLLQSWPPNSPDLNLIENVWSWVQRQVDSKGCQTFEEFKQAVISTMAAVPKQHLVNMFDGMKNRLQAVVDCGGDLTKY